MKKKTFYILFIILGLAFIISYEYIYKKSLVQIPILMYHHFDTENVSETTIHPKNFKKQLDLLKREGYESITIEELIDFLENDKKIPKKPILITIDDGYLSNYSLAYPILKEENMKATIFVVTSVRGKQPGVTPHFSWEQAKEMYDSGLINIQSHSYNSHFKVDTMKGEKGALAGSIHNDIKVESKEEYEERIRKDLLKSKEDIEKNVGNKAIALAYPFGEFSKTSERIAKELGYRATFAIKDEVNYENASPYKLKRIQVSGYDAEEDLIKKIKNSRKPFVFINKIKLKLQSIINQDNKYKEAFNEVIKVYVNNKEVTFPNQTPYRDNRNTILVAAEPMGEALGIRFSLDSENEIILFKNKDEEIKFMIDSERMYINGEEKQMNTSAILTNKRIAMIPLRSLAEALGENVVWNENEKAIYIER